MRFPAVLAAAGTGNGWRSGRLARPGSGMQRRRERDEQRERERNHCLWIPGGLPPGRISAIGLTGCLRRTSILYTFTYVCACNDSKFQSLELKEKKNIHPRVYQRDIPPRVSLRTASLYTLLSQRPQTREIVTSCIIVNLECNERYIFLPIRRTLRPGRTLTERRDVGGEKKRSTKFIHRRSCVCTVETVLES